MTLADGLAHSVIMHAEVAPSVGLAVLLGVAGLGSAVVLALALAALVRRRSRSYLLVALALSALLARTGVAVLSAAGTVGAESHHVLEHGLDAAMAGLVIAAVYDARSARRSADAGRSADVTPSTDDSGGEDP